MAASLSKTRSGRKRTTTARSKRAGNKKRAEGSDFILPLTVSRDALMPDGSDRRFRRMVSNLLTLTGRMELIREHYGRSIGVSGPQYSLMLCIAHLQDGNGVSVGRVAEALHVSSAFIASETGALARRGLVLKRTNPEDRRGVLLSLSAEAEAKIKRLAAEIRVVNDLLFGRLDAKSFAALSTIAADLIETSAQTVERIERANRSGKRR